MNTWEKTLAYIGIAGFIVLGIAAAIFASNKFDFNDFSKALTEKLNLIKGKQDADIKTIEEKREVDQVNITVQENKAKEEIHAQIQEQVDTTPKHQLPDSLLHATDELRDKLKE